MRRIAQYKVSASRKLQFGSLRIERVAELRPGNHRADLCVVQDVGDLGTAQTEIDRYCHQPRSGQRDIDFHPLQPIVGEQADPVAGAQAPPAIPAPPEATVDLLGAPSPRRLTASEISRGGLFVRAEADLPPLFSRVQLAVGHPALRAKLSLVGEVVRHVTPAEATQWRMAPGFAVQLTDLTPERRAGLADLAEATRAGPRPEAAAAVPPAERLRELEARPSATHYGLLGLGLDAEFSEVRRVGRELRAELEAIRARPRAADQHGRATALLGRLDAALHTLSVPSERLLYDSQRGNYLGVARCVAAGIPQAVIEARRREYLARHPGREQEAAGHLARAQLARKLRNVAAATASYQAALAADPLDLATLDAYVTFRRQAGG